MALPSFALGGPCQGRQGQVLRAEMLAPEGPRGTRHALLRAHGRSLSRPVGGCRCNSCGRPFCGQSALLTGGCKACARRTRSRRAARAAASRRRCSGWLVPCHRPSRPRETACRNAGGRPVAQLSRSLASHANRLSMASIPVWHPESLAARLPFLRRRGLLLAATRAFFTARGYTEVETPYAVTAPGEEVHLSAFATERRGTDGSRTALWLHTSPEFAMKRLLVAGSGPIFQIARVWRNGEGSARHARRVHHARMVSPRRVDGRPRGRNNRLPPCSAAPHGHEPGRDDRSRDGRAADAGAGLQSICQRGPARDGGRCGGSGGGGRGTAA